MTGGRSRRMLDLRFLEEFRMSRRVAALSAAAFAVVSLGAGSAHADWSFTKWGMTPDQVIKAAKGKASANPGDEGDRIMGMDRGVAGGPFAFEGRTFTADFYFDPGGGGLRVARLNMVDQSQCDALGAALEAKYGASSNKYHGEWLDSASGNKVFFSKSYKTGISLPCYLSYAKP